LPCSQGPATGPYPDPDESSPHPPTLSPFRSNDILPSAPRCTLQVFHVKFCVHLSCLLWRSNVFLMFY